MVIATHEGVPLFVELPTSLMFEVTYTEPGLQGDRSTGGTEPAMIANVPRFRFRSSSRPVRRSRSNTRDGRYLGRS